MRSNRQNATNAIQFYATQGQLYLPAESYWAGVTNDVNETKKNCRTCTGDSRDCKLLPPIALFTNVPLKFVPTDILRARLRTGNSNHLYWWSQIVITINKSHFEV